MQRYAEKDGIKFSVMISSENIRLSLLMEMEICDHSSPNSTQFLDTKFLGFCFSSN